MFVFFCFKQKTAYEMRISDWSSDVCSSDLGAWISRAAPALFCSAMLAAMGAETDSTDTLESLAEEPIPFRTWVAQPSHPSPDAGVRRIGRLSPGALRQISIVRRYPRDRKSVV